MKSRAFKLSAVSGLAALGAAVALHVSGTAVATPATLCDVVSGGFCGEILGRSFFEKIRVSTAHGDDEVTSNLVKILAAMEEAGIMKRKRSVRDKRAVELSLSASGQRRADEASRLGEIFNAKTLAPLSKPEQSAFVQMLARLAEAYRHELSSRSESA